jgi:hypothetical protein
MEVPSATEAATWWEGPGREGEPGPSRRSRPSRRMEAAPPASKRVRRHPTLGVVRNLPGGVAGAALHPLVAALRRPSTAAVSPRCRVSCREQRYWDRPRLTGYCPRPGERSAPEPKDWMGWRSQAGGTRIGRPAHSRHASATMPRAIQSSTWASIMSNARSKPARELPSNSRPSTSWLPWSLSHSHATVRYDASCHRRTDSALSRTGIHDRIRTSMVTLSTSSGVQWSSVPSHSTSLEPTRYGLHSLRLRCARRVAKSVSPSRNWSAPSSPPRAPTKSTPTSGPGGDRLMATC